MSQYQNLTTDQLADELVKEGLSEEQKKEIATEMIKNIGLKVAVQTLLTTARYLHMQEGIKAVIEEDGEIYMIEMRKIADTAPEKGERSAEKDIESISMTIEKYK